VYITGLAFEGGAGDLKKVFRKCGDLLRLHVFTYAAKMVGEDVDKKVLFNTVQKKANKHGELHHGEAVAEFKSLVGVDMALKLDGYTIKGPASSQFKFFCCFCVRVCCLFVVSSASGEAPPSSHL
jgi:hypothetical protein